MKNKKKAKDSEESNSSSSSSESDSDSSRSSSQSRKSSPVRKKSKKEIVKEKQYKSKKHRSSSENEYNQSSNTKKHIHENSSRNKHNLVEHSKWDSPKEKYDRKERKTEKHRRSYSAEAENHNIRSALEKEHDLDRRHSRSRRDERSRDYDRNRNEDSLRHEIHDKKQSSREHHERYDRYDDRQRNNYHGDRNRSRHDRDRTEDYNEKKYSHHSSTSGDCSRDRSSGYDKHRNRRRRSRSSSFNHAEAKWGKQDDSDKIKTEKSKEKEKPNFGLSGKLTEETNTYRGFVIKYSEPPEARKPKRRWRLYPFKGEKALQTLYIHRESAYLIGRERKIVDLPVDHPSCSKQHAVLQYRLVSFTREDGSQGKRVRPYLIDLESANGTFINNKKIEPKKYIELLEKDVIKFGYSSREYVLLHENSKDEGQDDDVKEEEVYEPVKKEKD